MNERPESENELTKQDLADQLAHQLWYRVKNHDGPQILRIIGLPSCGKSTLAQSVAQTLQKQYSEGVKRDLVADDDFWEKYNGKIQKISNTVNNSYLKSNGQSDGTESYGRMVDLLLVQYKRENKMSY